jgi:hypothetical protein
MIHLAGPHLCPVCNIVHDVEKERASLRGDTLRPYFATYTPSKFPPVGLTSYDFVPPDINLQCDAQNHTVTTWTVPKSGYWMLAWRCFIGGTTGSYNAQPQAALVISTIGSGSLSGAKPDNNTADTVHSVAGVFGPVAAGTVVTLSGRCNGDSAGTRLFYSHYVTARFIPEASYPQ